MNKDTMIIVAVFIALVTCFYLFNENKRKLFIFVASDNVVADIELKVSETAKDYQFKDEFEKTYLHT